MPENDRIRRILIVGGGTAGWMAAAYLRRRTDCAITLVESAGIGTIGVGEATIPSMTAFVRNMGFDELELMRRCHATYKLGIKFLSWVRRDHAYWHPFGICGGLIDGIDVFHFWLKSMRAGHDEGPYSSYSTQALLGEAGKAPRGKDDSSIVIRRGAYAFHLDAAALADYLREHATGAADVEHVVGDVRDVVLAERGFIDRVDLEDGRSLSADLYIDCTGFRGLLMEQALGDPWIDWSDRLLCDRAVVVRLPRDVGMHPYTRATALGAGWAWQIPLSHRVGCGYVHSSAHAEADVAARDLLAFAGGIPDSEPLRLEMRVGRRREFWVRNCVAVGLSAGFLEPLESTGLFFIDKALQVLVECFPDRSFDAGLIDAYNRRVGAVHDEIRDFVLLHYLLTQRDDTAYWRDCRQVGVPDSLQGLLDGYDGTGMIETGRDTPFPDVSFYHVLSGCGRLPRRHLPRADFSDFDKAREFLFEIKKRNLELSASLPAHGELMDWLHDPTR